MHEARTAKERPAVGSGRSALVLCSLRLLPHPCTSGERPSGIMAWLGLVPEKGTIPQVITRAHGRQKAVGLLGMLSSKFSRCSMRH